ncbi:P antigen family member 3-like [Myotis daubentonii]|uniref:P antigen family member 3-like n=1 Tax=Myotis daubentonii TaxID=98922 RepID=UPI0028735A76|nr:P antigen family member 3-like [Myotis daubentonii]
MSRPLTPRLDWSSILVEDEESNQPVGAVADQQPRDEQPQQEEPPTESQDIAPDEEQAHAGAPEVQEADLEADVQELEKPVTGVEGGDDPEIIGYACANPEPIEMPETGEGKPDI